MKLHATAAKSRLWESIRARKLGVAFRRQVVLGQRHIVDFFAREVGLAREIDGGYHARRAKADARRDAALRRLGCRVLRLEAELVMRELPEAVARIAAELESRGAPQ